ncbi:hypothetical protein QOT17_012425 [Balamuthia mandrillaris]
MREERMALLSGPEGQLPPQLFVEFPSSVSLAFNSKHLSNEPGWFGEHKPIEIPAVLLEREDTGLPSDIEDDYNYNPDDERTIQRLRSDLQRRKQIFMVFLALDIIYCFLSLIAYFYISPSHVSILALNVLVSILTFYGVIKERIWVLNLFVVVEGVAIGFFLFNTFSPLVVLRLIVLLLGAQVRARMMMIQGYDQLGAFVQNV